MQLHVDLPDALADKDTQELAALGREALGASRREFLDLLGRYNVSIFDDTMDVRNEAGKWLPKEG